MTKTITKYICPECGWVTLDREAIILHMALIHPELFDKRLFRREINAEKESSHHD